jgi:hypothetical protein
MLEIWEFSPQVTYRILCRFSEDCRTITHRPCECGFEVNDHRGVHGPGGGSSAVAGVSRLERRESHGFPKKAMLFGCRLRIFNDHSLLRLRTICCLGATVSASLFYCQCHGHSTDDASQRFRSIPSEAWERAIRSAFHFTMFFVETIDRFTNGLRVPMPEVEWNFLCRMAFPCSTGLPGAAKPVNMGQCLMRSGLGWAGRAPSRAVSRTGPRRDVSISRLAVYPCRTPTYRTTEGPMNACPPKLRGGSAPVHLPRQFAPAARLARE